ncbi:orotate phosphoribosyltransferase [Arcanobacterium ihumii]|uniref:orotate phosphoribosyltransferase n=1 Tax=Arcanobacterium ihumii TaxID=2138162 RepID=UPI000F51E89F|nr:orotate phosphoribosyltransferase [Arcanobacterium ihumii]
MDDQTSQIARGLLDIGAVFFRPDDPFIWASGIKSPVYCDNRLILSSPKLRDLVEDALTLLVERAFPEAEVIMGTATAGIAHAALIADRLGIPMGYVRSSNKDHGRKNQIEGKLEAEAKIVVVEDLISTAGSVLDAVNTLKDVGADVIGVASIFSYGMKEAQRRFEEAELVARSLVLFDDIVQVAADVGFIKPTDVAKLLEFRDDPSNESWMECKENVCG